MVLLVSFLVVGYVSVKVGLMLVYGGSLPVVCSVAIVVGLLCFVCLGVLGVCLLGCLVFSWICCRSG